jgi:hypothetical protein
MSITNERSIFNVSTGRLDRYQGHSDGGIVERTGNACF